MSTNPAAAEHSEAVEHTTALALEEKAKLRKVLRRIDLFFFTLCALVGLDTLGTVAAQQEQGFTWLIILGVTFVIPYALVMSELGSTFTQEGGPYEWMKLCWGRFSAAIGAIMYWVTNPLWVGGSLAFVATAAWDANISGIGSGTWGDYLFKLVFIWFSIVVAIASLSRGKWIPNLGAIMRVVVLGFFTITVIVYAAEHGVHGLTAGNFSPEAAALFALAPVILFNYVGFELGNGAAEEMVNPQRDIPVAVIRAAMIGITLYVIPIFGIIFVLPQEAITGLGGFIDAVNEVFSVYGAAADPLLVLMSLGFIFTLMTSGAVWMIGADRIQAVAAYDGAFFPMFGKFSAKLGTPVRVNLLSGVAATVFMAVAVNLLNSESAADAFYVVLTIAISTTLISYLWIFPTAIRLRQLYPDVHRPYRVPGGNAGMWVAAGLITFWVALGSFTAVFPSVLERLFGIDYGPFEDTWGVSFGTFEALSLGTLAIVVLVGIWGYWAGRNVRAQEVDVLIEGGGETVVPHAAPESAS